MRTPDVIALEMMDVDYWMYRESMQLMSNRHDVTYDGLKQRITEQRKHLTELERAIAKMMESAA